MLYFNHKTGGGPEKEIPEESDSEREDTEERRRG